MTKLLSLVWLVVAIGCSPHVRNVHYSRDLSLSLGRNVDIGGQRALRLISVKQDGTTVIELAGTGERFTAKPGDFFVSQAFGNQGLQLLSASPVTGEALLKQRWAEIK